MAIQLDPSSITPVTDANVPLSQTPAPRAPTKATAPIPQEPLVSPSQAPAAEAEVLQASVTFRRDAKGQIYYVLTDAQSGKEIREVPPAEIRKVGEGISEYLKQEEAKTTPHVDSKA
jgi:hypothetical protein